jgi:rhodanese-related sulfurtransferase
VDVRPEEDYTQGHIPGAINVPKERWHEPQGLEKSKTNVVYCYTQQCHLAANACVKFAGMGFPVMELEGGFAAWKESDQDVEETPTHRFRSSTPHETSREPEKGSRRPNREPAEARR